MAGISSEVAALRSAEFPVTQDLTWLNTASTGLLPACNVSAQIAILNAMARGETATGGISWWETAERARQGAAGLLECDPSDVALQHRTGEGIGLAATGLAWSAGDEVVLYSREFPSAVYPWLALRDQGVAVKFVHGQSPFRFTAADVAEAMTDRTRVVCLSLVNPYHGFRAPMEEIGALCEERGCWLVVDAAQAMGTMRVSPAAMKASLVAAHGYKGLCAGHGISICYIAPALRSQLKVVAPGWKSVERALEVDRDFNYEFELAAGARKFEGSIHNLAATAGMAASIELLTGVGIGLIELWLAELAAATADVLNDRGYEVVSSRRPGETSAILSARLAGKEPSEVQTQLREKGVVCAMRDDRLRVSLHVFNNHDDIEKLADALP
jgi:selenocysteine lyase/cysteine desulfurase